MTGQVQVLRYESNTFTADLKMVDQDVVSVYGQDPWRAATLTK